MDPLTGMAFALGAGSFLFDVFDKSVQAYRLYLTAQSLANVSGHLVAKLMIEERRLIQWGDGVGIRPVAQAAQTNDRELDNRLRKNEALYRTVRQALAGIEETLTDVDNLTTRYGLQVFEEKDVSDEISLRNELMLPLRPQRSSHESVFSSNFQGLSEALKMKQGQSRRIQASTSIRKKFQWAIKHKDGFELLLDRLRYYNDSLYSLLPKENINAIERDVLANLIGAAPSERLLQYASVASPSGRSVQDSFAATQYTTIASAAMASLQIADAHPLPLFDVWINETSISYDGEGSRLGTFSRKGFAPVRVFIETAVFHEGYTRRKDTRKATIKRIRELALLLKEPQHFGFATMACLGVVTDMNNEDNQGHNEIELVYELPPAADPLTSPVSLHDLLSLDEYRSEEPPEVDVRFQLVNSLAKALHEMHCTGWLHRNISSNNIFFLKTKHGSEIESLDLEKPYVAGFHAARSFASKHSFARAGGEYEGLIYIHPGYLLHRNWSEYKAKHFDISDKLFYMPRHDYYSIGLVFLEIGMWRSLHSLLLRDVPYFDYRRKPRDPGCTLVEKLETLARDVKSASQGIANDPDQDTEEEHSRRRRILEAYIADGSKLVEEEGLTDLTLDEEDLHSDYESDNWAFWDKVYGLHKLREDAIRTCQEKLGSRMGRRYREAVRRCLATDFGVSAGSSKNLDWLHAFNWRVVQELNRCCA